MQKREVNMASLFYFWYMNNTYDAVIFDFGGVIINIDYQATIDAFMKMGIPNFEEIYSQAAQSDLFDAIETGRISAQHFINGLLDILPKGISPNSVVHAWNAMILDIPPHRIEFLELLREKKPIYLLSNTNEIHIIKALREWSKSSEKSIHDVFNHVYLSNEMNMRKPDAEIFVRVCEEQGLTPERTLFIDDSIQHIAGAASIGLQTYHLQQGEEIQDVLS